MKRFKRVAETTGMPDYIERQFFQSDRGLRDDPYADLKESRAERRAQLSHSSGNFRRLGEDEGQQARPWERLSTAALYEQPQSMFDEDYEGPTDEYRYASTQGSVHRVQDTGTYGRDMVAPPDFKWCEIHDTFRVLQAQQSGYGSMWEVDSEVRDLCQGFAEQDNDMYDNEQRVMKRKAMHTNWEEGKRNQILRERRIVESRTNPLVRGGFTKVAEEQPSRESRFGMMDWDAVVAKENERRAMNEDRRERSRSIKAVDRHRIGANGQDLEWEDEAPLRNRARSTRDGYDSYGAGYSGGGNWTDRLSGFGRR
jgi:hypothetical protein